MPWFDYIVLFSITVLALYGHVAADTPCNIEGHDFSALDGVTWEADSGISRFHLSVCQPLHALSSRVNLQACGAQSAACEINAESETTNLGDFSSQFNTEEKDGVITLTLQGESCSAGGTRSTVINFKCGKSLGSPVFLDYSNCVTNFEWYTTVACKTAPTAKEVKCYVYNGTGVDADRIDLSPLIRNKGGYPASTDFILNVCRDITPDAASGTESCQEGAACLPGAGIVAGRPHSPPEITPEGNVRISYTSEPKGDDGCALPRSTNITFSCPQKGQSKDPLLLFGEDCHYEVVWETEYACPEKTLHSSTCVMTGASHGIDVDLTALGLDNKEYTTTGTNSAGDQSYTYRLSVCGGGLTQACGDLTSGAASCQVKDSDNSALVLGLASPMSLRYVDDELVLTYNGGAICHHSSFHRETVINFHCNTTAGIGTPQFTYEDDCTYVFDWVTSYACVHLPELTCHVEGGGKEYDLGALRKDNDEANWEAERADPDTDDFVVINVCGSLTGYGLAALCDSERNAACSLVKAGQWRELGRPSSPYYNPETGGIEVRYEGGSDCSDGKQFQSLVRFYCKPGHLETAPVLVTKSTDGCTYEFEWHTEAACPQNSVSGENCQLHSPQQGVSFDLSPLTKAGPSDGFYTVEGGDTGLSYYINICAKLQGSPCNDQDRGDMGACQTVSGGHIYNTGMANSLLHYADGVLNLAYTNGDNYRHDATGNPVGRITEITFTCDPTADPGQPQFFMEEPPVYAIKWATKYACPTSAMECLATDSSTHAQYDLSSLVKSDSNWVTSSFIDGKDYTFYINLCRSIVAGVEGCSRDAGICEVPQDGEAVNLGTMKTGPKVDKTGNIVVEYIDGDTCVTDSSKNISTNITLQCQQGATATTPVFVTVMDCVYVFEWSHAVACSIEDIKPSPSEVCTLTDPTLDYTFNLKPLMGQDFTVTHDGHDFKLHICGSVEPGTCPPLGDQQPAACVDDRILVGVTTTLAYSEAGYLTLTYDKGETDENGNKYKVVVEFICDRTVGVGAPYFKERDGTLYSFGFRTSYACPPAPISCTAVDGEDMYDLSRLAKGESEGNWEVIDVRAGHADLRYYINVCKPVNAEPLEDNFCGGLVGACQTTSENSYNLGYLQGAPVVQGSGTLVLTYSGGDPCHVGKENEGVRTTVITLTCADTQMDPVFTRETEDCQYHFDWSTPAACPLQVTKGSDCKVTEPAFHTTFDLSSLRKQSDYYPVPAGVYEYWLNVCGALADPGEGCEEAANCQTKDTLKINGGKASSDLTYHDGTLRLTYEHGKAKCHGTYERRTIITFTCDHSTTANQLPSFLSESPICEYLFEWRTPLACPPRSETTECSIRGSDGSQYDLSPLRSTASNYVYIDSTTNTQYLINVCANVIHGKDAACPPESAVCAVKLDVRQNKYENVGSVSDSHLEVSGQKVILRYNNKRPCSSSGNGYSEIRFSCDRDAIDTQPELVDADETCHLVFEWHTSAACPLTESIGSDCKVSNPVTGHEFDLSPLKGQTYTFPDNTGTHKFDLAVCEVLTNSKCDAGTASCQYETSSDKKWNSGTLSNNLSYNDGLLQLTYTGGDTCKHNNQQRSTVINFVCGLKGSGNGRPVFISEDESCTYFVTWHTELACETEPTTCSLTDGDVLYDLSPLVLREGYHSAVTTSSLDPDEDASYFINLCRPLNPIPGVMCPPTAAVCKATADRAISLGQAGSGPALDAEGQLSVLYENGDPCPSSKKWSSKIIFTCAPGLSTGTPSLEAVNMDDCLYIFSWPSNLACKPESTPDVDNDCSFKDSRTQYTFDFSDLTLQSGDVPKQITTTKGSYYLNVCGSVSPPGVQGCADSAVCLVTSGNQAISFGKASKMSFLSSEYDVKLNYGDGQDCGGKPRQAHILMECDWRSMGRDNIAVSYEGDCDVVFNYKTHLACTPEVKDCVIGHAGDVFDLGPLSRETHSWSLLDIDQNRYWLNLCQGVHEEDVDCPVWAAVCWKPNGNHPISVLGTVQSQTMTVDGKGPVIIEYKNDDVACREYPAEKPRGTATVRIYLRCGSGVGRPVVMVPPSVDPCVFELEWNTTYACNEQTEPVYPVGGKITDPETGVSIKISELTGDKTYKLTADEYKYIVNLKGRPDHTDCLGMTVCRTDQAESIYCSLGEASTVKYLIRGEILEAQFNSPTVCEKDSTIKPSTVINFKCVHLNESLEPTFIYKSMKGQYVFDWETPAVCELAKVYGDLNRAQQSGQGSVNSKTLGIVLGVFMTLIVIGGLVFLMYKPERRARVIGAVQRVFRRSGGYTTYVYSELNQTEDSSNSLLGGARETYGADSGTLGNIQAFHDDSDEDILQL